LDHIQGRRLVKAVIYRCVICRRFEGRSFNPPPAPPLPSFPVSKAPPFAYIAEDFAGPLYVNQHGQGKSRKTWICLFSCCVTMARYLENVGDVSTARFIRALKRFSVGRGFAIHIFSDNAKTFKAASKFMK